MITPPDSPAQLTQTTSKCTDERRIRAEIIAIGDELTSGVRLDTNTQWVSKKLEELGIRVAFQTTVGDDLQDMKSAFQTATQRATLIITTGGLGPTADDLTRHAIAEVGEVKLLRNEQVFNHIREMYASRDIEMPPNNEIQAWFPTGSTIIENPEGTAPGIEFSSPDNLTDPFSGYRIFSFPGVPAELKQMWSTSAESRIRELFSIQLTTHHHTLHCFGSGESAIEMLIPDLTERGRDPLVGITASAATISLRVATQGKDVTECQRKIEPTINSIRERLGDLVYGENYAQLEDALIILLNEKNKTISLTDHGLHGQVATRISQADKDQSRLIGSYFGSDIDHLEDLIAATADIMVTIGPVNRTESLVDKGESHFELTIEDHSSDKVKSETHHIRYRGHTSWREIRAVKDVLNKLRLFLVQSQ